MTLSQRTIAATAALAMLLPGAAHAAPSATSGKAGAPGQVCKSLAAKGRKTAEQKAARKACIKQAVTDRRAGKPQDDETTQAPTTVEPTQPAAPTQPTQPAPTA